MCGICGIIDHNLNTVVNEALLHKMCAELRHRGPDDEGVYLKRTSEISVGLGHRRLKIIDLSPAGHQPMSNEDGSIWLVFNGEVYNYTSLRKELEKKGHYFKSQTDTEAVIHLYEEHSYKCVNYLRGMFAFALWDNNKQILLISRDRVGKKPLLYFFKDGIFCFASEFLSLLSCGQVKKDINLEAINYYLTLGYIPAPFTIYRDIFKLPPGHNLILKNNEVKIEKYWQLDYIPKRDISESEACEEILKLLKESVKIRLHSDVPLGAFLSGGIDSSTIVGLMSQLSNTKVKTFSIGFTEKDYSELKYAENISRRFGTIHNEFVVKPDALKVLPLLIEHYGEPYADSSCIPTYYVAQQTKRYVTVAMNGDGGDELFAGYERYQAMLLAEKFQKLPNLIKKSILKTSMALADSIDPRNVSRKIKRFLNGASLPFQQRYLKWIGIFDDNLKNKIYSENFKNLISFNKPLACLSGYLNENQNLPLLDRILYADNMTYLPYDLLVKVDITSMANSLEARSPFLDHKLIEFVAKLAPEFKIRHGVRKYILKKIIKDFIPSENINRKKMGFGVPVGQWFRSDLKELLQETLLCERFFSRGYFERKPIKQMVMQHIEGRNDYSFQLWSFLVLELWHKRFID